MRMIATARPRRGLQPQTLHDAYRAQGVGLPVSEHTARVQGIDAVTGTSCAGEHRLTSNTKSTAWWSNRREIALQRRRFNIAGTALGGGLQIPAGEATPSSRHQGQRRGPVWSRRSRSWNRSGRRVDSWPGHLAQRLQVKRKGVLIGDTV
jgi:DNA ligase (NAD+)